VIVQTEVVPQPEVARIRTELAKVAGVQVNAVSTSTVGSKWGSTVSRKAVIALLAFLVAVTLYVSLRMEFKMAVAALVALLHDLIITAGIYALARFEVTPATVIAGSSMFPRDRVIVSLKKYDIRFNEDESTEDLRTKLAEFYARRTITRRPILPIDNANAICWLAGDQSAKTTGHVIPVDGGLPEAFLR